MSSDSLLLENNPLVSIIIPCYKQAHFLGEAIESCLNQTYSNLEIIVIDDGSPDDTSKVASSYSQVRCIRTENQGVFAARNRGLQESRGEYLIFLDSDDRLKSSAVELGLRHLIPNPSVAFAYGRCNFIDVDGEFIAVSHQPSVSSDYYRRLLSGNIVSHPGEVVFRRAPLEEGGGFQGDLHGVEDYELVLRLARLYEVRSYDDIVSDYRQHAGGLSRKAVLMAESMHKVLRAQEPFVQSDKERKKALKRGLRYWRRNHHATALVFKLNENVKERNWSSIPGNFLQLLRANPSFLFENAIRKTRVELRKLSSRT